MRECFLVTRRRRRPKRASDASIEQLPWGQIVYQIRPVDVLSQDQVEAIHLTSIRIVAEIGIEFMGEGAQDAFVARRKQEIRP